jgi:periplasmic divalent cation tolerance protein
MPATVVFSTFPSEHVATKIARVLVHERLVACVNVVPGVRSIYRWKDEIDDSREVLAIMKTTAARATALRARIIELHPYEVPEVIAVAVAAGHAPYLDWIETVTDSRSDRSRASRRGGKRRR